MNPLLKILLGRCKGNIYLTFGICMGVSLSLLLVPTEIRETDETRGYLFDSFGLPKSNEEYEVKVNIDAKPQQARKVPKTLIRPRYYSTELGIREKLFVGVMTSCLYLHDRDTALNKTVAHLVDKIRYFISIPEGVKPNVSLPGIVGFTDTRSILKPFHVLKYIADNYLEDYNYYFLIKDVSYVNARRLMEMVSKISVSQEVHMGVPIDGGAYCSLDYGILLSNSVIQKAKSNLDWCVQNTYSDLDDVNFGRCILHSSSLPCRNEIDGYIYLFTRLSSTFDFERNFSDLVRDEDLSRSISVYPIYEHVNLYRLHTYISMMRSVEEQKKINALREAIEKSNTLTPLHERNKLSWPIGNQRGNKALTRFDILRWTYFNETHIFFETDNSMVEEFKADAKRDIEHVTKRVMDKVIANNDQKLMYQRILNGYKKFDASRGMDYIFDLALVNSVTGQEVIKRVEVCKPLGKVEILSVPYVTENTRINLILLVDALNKLDALKFMQYYEENCMLKNNCKTFLMTVLLYNAESPSKGKKDIFEQVKQYALLLTEKYKKNQFKVIWHSIRLPTNAYSVELEAMLRVAITDLSVKKFSAESLLLFVETGTELKLDYLNRVRMNTISQYQIFSPIPFVEYHPDIAYVGDTRLQHELDVNRHSGGYDEYNFNSIAFYVKDYVAMRKAVEASIPMARSDKDIAVLLKLSEHNPISSVFDMFVSFSDVHALRAVEPALKVSYKNINCNSTSNEAIYKVCMKRRNMRLGSRSQLAKLILDYRSKLN